MPPFEGLIAAAHSPLTADGALAPDVVPLQAALHREQGIVGVFICGSTGEGHSLVREERCALADAWSEVTDDDLQLIVHVGCNALPDACALAEHAASVGACAVSAHAPCYEKPRTIDELVLFLAEVASAAPSIPFYYYDIPSFTGVSFPIEDVLIAAADRIPNLAGVKFTSVDDRGESACIGLAGGRFEVLHGCDERLMTGLEMGCRAAVGSTYNYAAPIYTRIMDLLEIGDRAGAEAAQRESVRLVEGIIPLGVLRAGKAIMNLLGVNCGPPRLPSTPLSEEELRVLRALLSQFDYLPRPLR